MRTGLHEIGIGLGAAAIGVSRVRVGTTDRSRIVICDMDQSNGPKSPLTMSYASTILKDYAEKSKPGSLWFASMFDDNLDPQLVELQRRRVWRELVIIPIGCSNKHSDFLELHFADKPGIVQLGLLDQVAETIVMTWQRRSPGLFAEAVLSRKAEKKDQLARLPLLDTQNPARLSRCEYRVCMLIGHGLSNSAIESELCISRSTLRSHLRNIYAKTETSSLAELTYALLSRVPAVHVAHNSSKKHA